MVDRNNWVSARPGTSLGYPATQFQPRRKVLLSLGVSPASVILPGPPTGYVRCYEPVCATGAAGATLALISITATVLPSARLIARVPSTAQGQTSSSGMRIRPLMPGETVRVANTGVNAVVIATTYVDIPRGLRPDGSPNIMPLDIPLSAVAADVLPAAPAGYIHRWLLAAEQGFMGGTGSILTATVGSVTSTAIPRVFMVNLDTVAHGFNFTQGGLSVTRWTAASAILNPNVNTSPPPPIGVWTRDDVEAPLQVVLTEAVVTTAPIITGAYELLPNPS